MTIKILTSIILSISSVASVADSSIAGKSDRNSSYTGAEQPAANVPAVPDFQRELKNISFSYAINSIEDIDFSQKQSHIQSRQFMLDVSGSQLKSGVSFNTSAKGALVRISAYDGNSAVEPQSLSLTSPKGHFKQGKAFDTLVSSSSMQKNGMGFQQGTTGFKLKESLGSGAFTLKAEQGVNANTRYRINVFEKNSTTEMHLTANKSNYLNDDVLTVNAKVFDKGRTQEIIKMSAKVVSPSGESFDVIAKPGKDGYVIEKPLTMSALSIPGALWELHTDMQVKVNGQTIQRNGQLPFAYAVKTAKLTNSATIFGQKQAPVATVPVQANTDGRYEVRAVLYGTDESGNLKPVMLTHSAANLAAGEGVITLTFDPQIIQQSGVSAPYKVEQVELRDQSQMALID